MNELLLPHEPPAARIEGEQRVGEAIAALALTAVVVRARRARRYQHQPVLLVDRHHTPGVSGTGVLRLRELPVRGRRVRSGVRQGIERPQLRAAFRVVSSDHAALDIRRTIVTDGGAYDHYLAEDSGRGGD